MMIRAEALSPRDQLTRLSKDVTSGFHDLSNRVSAYQDLGRKAIPGECRTQTSK